MDTSRLQKCHDIIKNHPYRLYFNEEDEEDYKRQLLELSYAWSDIIYDPRNDEQKLRKFGGWIHDYRTILYRRKGSTTYWTKFFTYFEAMLQVTHVFLDTGNCDVYYNPRTVWKEEAARIFDKYVYVTSEDCKFDSKYLPGYFCVTTPYDTDDERMMQRFREWYGDNSTAKAKFQIWDEREKPIWEYMNNRQVGGDV